MFKKIVTYLLIISVIVPALAPAGFSGLNAVYAQEQGNNNQGNNGEVVNNGQGSNNGKIEDPCGGIWKAVIGGGTPLECMGYLFVGLGTKWILPTAVFITNLAADLFNASIEFSLSGQIFDTSKNIMLATGWTMVRDLINLVFIFVVLYLAVSVILQYGGASIKKVLPSIIIAAVLVNFSMLITKMVIDASHIFAWEFYNQIDADKGGTVGNIKSDLTISGDFKRKNIGNVFMAGFNPQNILTADNKESVKSVLQKAATEGENAGESWWALVLPVFLEATLALLAAFVLFAGTIMFVVRVVVLWLVMMFSPLMILGTVLPSMKKLSGMWWDNLIKQSFFAPAFLFMFVLVTKLINSGFLKSITQTTENSNLKLAFGMNAGSILVPFFHFFVVGGLMWASLEVARRIGGKTASVSIGWAHTARGWAQSAAGKTAKYGVGKPLGYGVGAGLDNLAGRINTGKGTFAQTLRAFPGLGGWARDRSMDVRERMKKKTDQFKGYTEQELKETLQAPEKALPFFKQISQFTKGASKILDRDKEAAVVQQMAERKNLRDLPEETIKKTEKRMESYGMKTKDIKNLQWQFAPQNDVITPAAIAERENVIQGLYNSATNKWTIPKLNASVIEDIDIEKYFDKSAGTVGHNPMTYAANAPVRKAMYGTFHSGHIQNFFKRNDAKDISDRFFKNMESDFTSARPGVAKDINELITWLEDPAYGIENRQLSSWARSRSGEDLLRSYGWT
ncbi:MAG: hypothetical protein L6Q29_02810 [Candidatus Pacebacteria bacterium]|nr:hypothetical protein [Candidatus Paceibacterota bacterium]